jgi:hypothetical protein
MRYNFWIPIGRLNAYSKMNARIDDIILSAITSNIDLNVDMMVKASKFSYTKC